ncbi:MAG: calcium-binding protein [Asticcacaulis sp.]|nr:calcium-binding protein [Asticcacaulis sp.]
MSFDFGTQHIENLTLTGSGNLTGTGNGLVNILTGNGGNNVLDGRQGADTLYGGAGNDTYYVDNAGDRVYETTASATDAGGVDTVIALVRVTLSNFVENLILGGTANLTGTGNSLDNILTGNDGINSLSGQAGNDIIDGGLGADLMVGGLGDDTYYIDNAGDKILESSGQGTDTVFSSVTFNTGSQYIEIVTLTGSDAINANGNTLANTLNGNDAVNKLDGGAGDDTLNGGGGNDLLVGGSGADLYVFGANSGADIISGFLAAQNDRIDLHAISAGTVNGGGVTISQSGADTLIDLGGGNTVTILNTTATDANFLSHIVW